ncbi:hypothetical protein ABFX02_13G033600 [Erythranthe guttata]
MTKSKKLRKNNVEAMEEGWAIMEDGIAKVKNILEELESQFSSEEYMRLYTTMFNLAGRNNIDDDYICQQLYNNYKESVQAYIMLTVNPSLRDKHDEFDEFMLRELVRRWSDHKVMVKWLSRFLSYLDRYFVVRKKIESVKDHGFSCFRDMAYGEVKHKAKDAVIALVNKEREGGQIDRALLKNVLDVFVEMGKGKIEFYTDDFEDAMLKDTAHYYSRKASQWIFQDSCPDYMLKVEECLKTEKNRVSHYLHSSSETKLLEQVENELLVVYANQLLEKETGCRALLRDDKVDELSRMYRLFHNIPKGLEEVAKIFKEHVHSEGLMAIQMIEDATFNKTEKAGGARGEHALMTTFIELHNKYSAYTTGCFCNNAVLHKALKQAFESFCNQVVCGTSNADHLASYCDYILKKGGSEKISDEAIDESMDKIVKLLAYISDKDLFAEFSRKKLSRRLLFDRNVNDDHERLFLTKLKQQCGGQCTSKMEGMVTDLALAKENQNQFHEYLINNNAAIPGMDLTVNVLTTGFWPTYKTCDLRLPAEMVKCVQVFKEHYEAKTKHRKLTWIYSLGTCSINGKFDSKTIELVVGTYQGAVLLLFNDAQRLSYSDIKTQLNFEDDDLMRVLHSLSCSKYKILKKDPDSKFVSPNDYFEFNSKFTDKMRRIRIPLPVVDDRKKVIQDVDNDRRYSIDAALVRIMKGRKILGHQQLILECVEMLSHMFKPDVKVIKKRIEDLLARDYLERDAENPNLYKYVA